MANAYQCDRCGRLFTQPSKREFHITKGQYWKIDLCEICYKELENFMLKYKGNEQ